MAKETISVSQEFNAPREKVFAILADPYKTATISSFGIKRIKDSTGDDVNGVGSVRILSLS